MEQEFLSVPLLKQDTNKKLEKVKTGINQIAYAFKVSVVYVTDRENGWFKAKVKGEGVDVIQFLLHMASLNKGE